MQVLYGVLTPAFLLAPMLARGGLQRPSAVLAALSVPFFLGTFIALNHPVLCGILFAM